MSNDLQTEHLRGTIDLGARTVQSLILVNGGAGISILTFYGNTLSTTAGEGPGFDHRALVVALTMFGFGVGAAVFASIFAYFSQLATVTTGKVLRSTESALRMIAVFAGLVSAVCFMWGIVEAGSSFSPSATRVQSVVEAPSTVTNPDAESSQASPPGTPTPK